MWKTAVIIPILKPGKFPCCPDSYRPISLLRILSKLAEKIILTRLNDHLITNNILISQQHGFRAQLSISHQLLRVVEYVKTGLKDKRSTGVIFLHIQKAFDRVLHLRLLYKLIWINTSPHLTKIIRSYLSRRNFAVRVNNTYSSYKNVNSGVPQGSFGG
ncbi:RNA-directed DNA polymerase from mobile element jockey [Trichonephila clavipes]|nr:RNA-directed DNA polymerase from mobile element jockey [Trichonephila clavipes]